VPEAIITLLNTY